MIARECILGVMSKLCNMIQIALYNLSSHLAPSFYQVATSRLWIVYIVQCDNVPYLRSKIGGDLLGWRVVDDR